MQTILYLAIMSCTGSLIPKVMMMRLLVPTIGIILALGAIDPAVGQKIYMVVGETDNHRTAKRVKDAIHGKRAYDDADFVRPMMIEDRAALAVLGRCKFETLFAGFKRAERKGRLVWITDADKITLEWKCPGLRPRDNPQLALFFEAGKIARIETIGFAKLPQVAEN